jgi:hypothetical protein
MKIKFIEDYEAKGTNLKKNDPNIEQASYMLTYSFKKGDVFDGEKIVVGVGIETGSPAQYAVKITTPEALKVDGTKWSGQAIFEVPEEAVTEQTLSSTGQTFFQKHKNHLILVGVLVLGYFAFKKFNK